MKEKLRIWTEPWLKLARAVRDRDTVEIGRRRKWILLAGYLLTFWTGIACIGYGLTLQSLSSWINTDFSHGEVRRGKIRTIETVTGGITAFTIDGLPLKFLVPPEFVVKNLPRSIRTYLQITSEVTLKSTMQGVILELAVNPDTPYMTWLVGWGTSTALYADFIRGRVQTGRFYAFLGLLLILCGPAIHIGLNRFLRTGGGPAPIPSNTLPTG